MKVTMIIVMRQWRTAWNNLKLMPRRMRSTRRRRYNHSRVEVGLSLLLALLLIVSSTSAAKQNLNVADKLLVGIHNSPNLMSGVRYGEELLIEWKLVSKQLFRKNGANAQKFYEPDLEQRTATYSVYVGAQDRLSGLVTKEFKIDDRVAYGQPLSWRVSDGCELAAAQPCFSPSERYWFLFEQNGSGGRLPVVALGTSTEYSSVNERVVEGFRIRQPVLHHNFPTSSRPGIPLVFRTGVDEIQFTWTVSELLPTHTARVSVVLQFPPFAKSLYNKGEWPVTTPGGSPESMLLKANAPAHAKMSLVILPELPPGKGYSVIFQTTVLECGNAVIDLGDCRVVQQLQTRSPLFNVEGPQFYIVQGPLVVNKSTGETLRRKAVVGDTLMIRWTVDDEFHELVGGISVVLENVHTSSQDATHATKQILLDNVNALDFTKGDRSGILEFTSPEPPSQQSNARDVEQYRLVFLWTSHKDILGPKHLLAVGETIEVSHACVTLLHPPSAISYHDEVDVATPVFSDVIHVHWSATLSSYLDSKATKVAFYLQPYDDDETEESVEIVPDDLDITAGSYVLTIPGHVHDVAQALSASVDSLEFELVMIVYNNDSMQDGIGGTILTKSVSQPFFVGHDSQASDEDRMKLMASPEFESHQELQVGEVIHLSLTPVKQDHIVTAKVGGRRNAYFQLLNLHTGEYAKCGHDRCKEMNIPFETYHTNDGGFAVQYQVPSTLSLSTDYNLNRFHLRLVRKIRGAISVISVSPAFNVVSQGYVIFIPSSTHMLIPQQPIVKVGEHGSVGLVGQTRFTSQSSPDRQSSFIAQQDTTQQHRFSKLAGEVVNVWVSRSPSRLNVDSSQTRSLVTVKVESAESGSKRSHRHGSVTKTLKANGHRRSRSYSVAKSVTSVYIEEQVDLRWNSGAMVPIKLPCSLPPGAYRIGLDKEHFPDSQSWIIDVSQPGVRIEHPSISTVWLLGSTVQVRWSGADSLPVKLRESCAPILSRAAVRVTLLWGAAESPTSATKSILLVDLKSNPGSVAVTLPGSSVLEPRADYRVRVEFGGHHQDSMLGEYWHSITSSAFVISSHEMNTVPNTAAAMSLINPQVNKLAVLVPTNLGRVLPIPYQEHDDDSASSESSETMESSELQETSKNLYLNSMLFSLSILALLACFIVLMKRMLRLSTSKFELPQGSSPMQCNTKSFSHWLTKPLLASAGDVLKSPSQLQGLASLGKISREHKCTSPPPVGLRGNPDQYSSPSELSHTLPHSPGIGSSQSFPTSRRPHTGFSPSGSVISSGGSVQRSQRREGLPSRRVGARRADLDRYFKDVQNLLSNQTTQRKRHNAAFE